MSLIASVLHLDRAAIKALRVTDLYSLHRVVYSLYPDVRSETDKADSASSGILYADLGGDIRGRRILMLSNRTPAAQVDDQYGQVQSKSIPEGFIQSREYAFSVVMNPTRRDSASGKLKPIKGRDAIAAWFLDRAPSWGFTVDPMHLQVMSTDVQQFKEKNQRLVTLAQANIKGRLRVTDLDQFAKSFAQGIGRGRTFGCGLLQLAPITSTNPV